MITVLKSPSISMWQWDYSINGKGDTNLVQIEVVPPHPKEAVEYPPLAKLDQSPLECEQYIDTRVVRIQRIAPRLVFSRGDDPPDDDSSLTNYQPHPHVSQPLPQTTAPTEPPILTILSEDQRNQKAIAFSHRPARFVHIVLWDAIAHPGRHYPLSSQRPVRTPRFPRYPIYLPTREPDWGP
jgi:hypothetical protein